MAFSDYCCQPVDTSARGGDDKRTPLHDAVESNHLSTVKLLLECGGKGLEILHFKNFSEV